MRRATTILAGMLVVGLGSTAWVWAARPVVRGTVVAQTTGYRIDINSADAATLRLLPGVGPGLAQCIIAARERSGRFASVDQLINVSGVGPMNVRAGPALGNVRGIERNQVVGHGELSECGAGTH